MTGPDGKAYKVAFMNESGGKIPQGKYLVEPNGAIAFVVDPGIGGRAPFSLEKADGALPAGAEKKGTELGPDHKQYDLVEVASGQGVAAGRYLVSDGRLAFRLRDVTKLNAPKASLFALIIDGILTRKLPWSLVLVGVMLAIVMELCGVASLPFAVGVYLPLSTSVPIFVGGIVRYIVDKRRKAMGKGGDEDFSPGTLLSSGYIAGGAIAGLVAAVVAGFGWEDRFDLGAKIGPITQSNVTGILAFAIIAIALYRVAQKGEGAVKEKA
jgi:hypothetical protein